MPHGIGGAIGTVEVTCLATSMKVFGPVTMART